MKTEKELIEIRDKLNSMLELLKNCEGRFFYKHYQTQRDMLDFVLDTDFNVVAQPDEAFFVESKKVPKSFSGQCKHSIPIGQKCQECINDDKS